MTTRTPAIIALLATPSLAFEGAASSHFETRQAYVNHLNAQPGQTWTAGVNARFRDKPIGDSKTLCGIKKNKDYKEELQRNSIPQSYFDSLPTPPDTFDSATFWPECRQTITGKEHSGDSMILVLFCLFFFWTPALSSFFSITK